MAGTAATAQWEPQPGLGEDSHAAIRALDDLAKDSKYDKWCSGLEGFKDRAEQRRNKSMQYEAEARGLELRREDARHRQKLEERRKQETANRSEQRRKEAAEYSTWRANLVLARKAEERSRAAEHCEWRDHIAKLRCGLSVGRGTQATVLGTAPGAAAVLRATSDLHTALPPSAVAADAAAVAGEEEEDEQRKADLEGVPTWCLDDPEQQKLAEERAWDAAVARNRSALTAERERRQQEAAKLEYDRFKLRILGGSLASAHGGRESFGPRRPPC